MEASWGRQVVDYLKSLTPRSSATVRTAHTSGGCTYEAVVKGGGGTAETLPWDLYQSVAEGDPATSYNVKLWPGAFGGVIPGNMFTAISLPASGTMYLIVTANCAGGGVQSCTLSASGSPPSPQAETLGAPPSIFAWTVGVWVDRTYFNMLQRSPAVFPRETLRETDPAATPYGLPYRSYYVWEVS